MGAKGRALLIFDFWLRVDLVFHESLTRHAEMWQHGELDLRMDPYGLRITMCSQRG